MNFRNTCSASEPRPRVDAKINIASVFSTKITILGSSLSPRSHAIKAAFLYCLYLERLLRNHHLLARPMERARVRRWPPIAGITIQLMFARRLTHSVVKRVERVVGRPRVLLVRRAEKPEVLVASRMSAYRLNFQLCCQ